MAEDVAALRILLLSDGVPGHVNQALGLIDVLESRYRIETVRVEVPLKARFLRPLASLLLNRRGKLPQWLLGAMYDFSLPQVLPDLILSAGGNTSFLNAHLGRVLARRTFFIGSLRRLDARLFSAVLTIEAVPGATNNIVMAIPPSRVRPGELEATGAAFRSGHEFGSAPLWAMIVGGDGAGFRYREEDWETLAIAMNRLAASHGCRWLITTSRRTGAAGDALLQKGLHPDLVADATWYSVAPRPIMAAYLGLAERLFVTADSMTMLAEAIAAQKPLVALLPVEAQPNQRFQDALDRFAAEEWLLPLPIDRLSELDRDWSHRPLDWRSRLLAQLAPYLDRSASSPAGR